MNVIVAYGKGFASATRFPRMLFVVYVANLFLSLLIALPFFGILSDAAGASVSLKQMLSGFHFTTLHDIMYTAGNAVEALQSEVKWVGITYLLLNAFFAGGILQTFEKRKFSVSSFFGGSGRYFFRIFLLNLIMLVAHLILLALFFVPVKLFAASLIERFEIEGRFLGIAAGYTFLYFLAFVLLLMISDHAKNFMVSRNSANFILAFFKGLSYSFRHFLKSYTLLLFLLVAPIGLFILYFYLDTKVEMVSMKGLLLTFAVHQAFIVSRIWARMWILGSQYYMYADDYDKDKQKKIEKAKRKALIKEQKKLEEKAEQKKEKIDEQTEAQIKQLEKQGAKEPGKTKTS